MPVQFINRSNSGGVQLVNKNNAGSVVFKFGGTSGPFSASVGYALTAGNACTAPISTFTMVGNDTTFCASTTFTAVQWNAVATGNYYVAYNGYTINVSHTFGQGFATLTGGGCQLCP